MTDAAIRLRNNAIETSSAVELLWSLAARGVRLRLGSRGELLVEGNPEALNSVTLAVVEHHRSALYRALSVAHGPTPVRFLDVSRDQEEIFSALPMFPSESSIVAFHLRAPLHQGRLQRATDNMIRRHQILRAAFRMIDGKVVCGVQRSATVIVGVVTGGARRIVREHLHITQSLAENTTYAPLCAVRAINHPWGRSTLLIGTRALIANGLDIQRLAAEILYYHEMKYEEVLPPAARLSTQETSHLACTCTTPHKVMFSGPVGVFRSVCPVNRTQVGDLANRDGSTTHGLLSRIFRSAIARLSLPADLAHSPVSRFRDNPTLAAICASDPRYVLQILDRQPQSTHRHASSLITDVEYRATPGRFQIKLVVTFQEDETGTVQLIYSKGTHSPEEMTWLCQAFDRALRVFA